MLISSSESVPLPQIFQEHSILEMWFPPLKVMIHQMDLVAGANNSKTQEVNAEGLLRVWD